LEEPSAVPAPGGGRAGAERTGPRIAVGDLEDGTPKAPGAGAISVESHRQAPKKLKKNRTKVWGYCAGVCSFGERFGMKYLLLFAVLYLVYRFYVRSRPSIDSGGDDDATYIDYEEIEEDDND